MTFSPMKAALLSAACLFSFPALATPSAALADAAWNAQVRETLVQMQTYPALALNAGLEGTVRVQLDVAEDGRVTGLKLLQSSGLPLLDRGAVRMLARLDRVPAPAAARSVEVPLTFRLSDREDGARPVPSSLSHWRDAVRRQVADKLSYTDKLAAAGVEGRLALRLNFDAEGRVTAKGIELSSGNDLLDAEVLGVAGKIGTLPRLPEGVTEDTIVLPVVYRLAENR